MAVSFPRPHTPPLPRPGARERCPLCHPAHVLKLNHVPSLSPGASTRQVPGVCVCNVGHLKCGAQGKSPTHSRQVTGWGAGAFGVGAVAGGPTRRRVDVKSKEEGREGRQRRGKKGRVEMEETQRPKA